LYGQFERQRLKVVREAAIYIMQQLQHPVWTLNKK